MANTGYGACQDVDATTAKAIDNRVSANKNVGGGQTAGQYLDWMTKRKPWVRAYSCASTGGVLGDTGKIKNISDLYHSSNRPKPGITDLSTTEEGTHGGFKEVVVKFVCWTKDDFAELAPQFLTYGRTITCEWGWTVDTSGTSVKAGTFEATRCKQNDFDFMKTVKAHRDNYEACMDVVRGMVTDFSWALAANGSFECEFTLTSMAGNTAKMPAKVATKDCSCPEDKKEDEAEKGPTYNVLQTLDSMRERCFFKIGGTGGISSGQTLTIDGKVCGFGMNSDAAEDQAGAEKGKFFQNFGGKIIDLAYITFECFEEYVVNHNIFALQGDGDEGTTRQQAATICGTGYGDVANSGNKYSGLFYSNHSVCRPGKTAIVSGDPTVCLIPGEKITDLTVAHFNNIGDIGSINAVASDGIYLGGICLCIKMLEDEFNSLGKDDGANVYVKKVLDRVSEACGGFWNFTMVPHSDAENIVQWIEIDNAPQPGSPAVLTIPSFGKNSIARSVSTNTESDPDFQAQIMYGSNNTNGKGGGNKGGGVFLWSSSVTDTFHTNTKTSSECAEQDIKENCSPATDQSTVEPDEEDLKTVFRNLGKEISPKSVAAAKRCARTLALGETKPDETARIIPVPITMDVELDGIGGFVFGNLITIDYLPSSYDGWCFQVTKVEHSVSNADWKTKLACGFMRKNP